MKPRFLLLAGAVLAALALAAACGGDDDNGGNSSEIRIEKGLSVAAISGGASGGDMAKSRLEADEQSTLESRPAFGAPAIPEKIGYPQSPLFQQASNGITVQGYGSAAKDADSATIDFYFGRASDGTPIPMPVPESRGGFVPGSSGSGGSTPAVGPDTDVQSSPELQEAQPVTEADIQPVIDAIVAQGVSRDDIEFLAQPYYDPYFASATLRVTVRSIDSVQPVVQAATNAAAALTNGVMLQSNNVAYTVTDCKALERAATEAAVSDAGERAADFAETLGVGLGGITGASNYSYAPYGGDPCGSNYAGPYPLVLESRGSQAPEVQVIANISLTYGIE